MLIGIWINLDFESLDFESLDLEIHFCSVCSIVNFYSIVCYFYTFCCIELEKLGVDLERLLDFLGNHSSLDEQVCNTQDS